MDDTKALYSVTIEWNGEKPPTTWYRRLGKLALTRGQRRKLDNPASPLASRMTHNHNTKGVLLQEGAFLVESESLANTIAQYALNGVETIDRKTGQPKVLKPAHVLIGKVQTVNPAHISEEDRQAINRINAAYGKRGKPLPKTDWIVTCYECLAAHAAYESSVATCPVCHGTRIEVAQGKPVRYDIASMEGKFSEYAIWHATRFGFNGKFQLPASSGPLTPPPPPTAIKPSGPISNARTPLCAADLEDTLALMDAIHVARTRHAPQKRLAARIDAIARYIQMGGDPAAVSHLFAEDSQHADILDAALLLGSNYVATLLLHQTIGVKP